MYFNSAHILVKWPEADSKKRALNRRLKSLLPQFSGRFKEQPGTNTSNNILLDLTQQRNSVSNHTIVQVTMQLQLTSCLLCLMKNDHVIDRLRKGPRYQKKKKILILTYLKSHFQLGESQGTLIFVLHPEEMNNPRLYTCGHKYTLSVFWQQEGCVEVPYRRSAVIGKVLTPCTTINLSPDQRTRILPMLEKKP